MNKHKILRSLVLGLATALVMSGVVYAATTITGTLKLAGTRKVDFDKGGSKIYDDKHLRIATDDYLYLVAPRGTSVSSDLDVAGDLDVTGAITGALTGNVTGNVVGNLTGNVTGNVVGNLTGDVTGSFTGDATGTTETTFTFGSGFDADLQNMILNLGSIDPAILSWTAATHTLGFTDNLAITGTTTFTGAVNSNAISSNSTISANGAISAGGAISGTDGTFTGDVVLGDESTDTLTMNAPVTLAATPSGPTAWTTAINSDITSTAVGTLGWFEFASTATSGDITGLRPIVTSNAASGGSNVRAVYGQAVVGADKYAALLQGVLATASVAPGGANVGNVHVLAGHFSTGASATITGDLYVGMLRAQTRGDESIAGNDALLGLVNEAVGGNGRQMDSAIRIFATNVSTPKAFNYGIDMAGAVGEINTADIRLSSGVYIMSGAGAPTATAPQGSMYLRTDGAVGGADTLYVNTDGGTTWVAR